MFGLFRRKKRAPISLDDNCVIEFTAEGRIIRVDPFEALDWIVKCNEPYETEESGFGYLDAMSVEICERYGLSVCSRTAAMRFYKTVLDAHEAATAFLKKNNGTLRGSRTGIVSMPASGLQVNGQSG